MFASGPQEATVAAIPYQAATRSRPRGVAASPVHHAPHRHLRLVGSGEEALAAEVSSAGRHTRLAARRRARARRRGVAGAGLVALVLCTGWFGLGALRGLGQSAPRLLAGATLVPSGQRYVAHVGDTLWSIAERVEPGADPRPLVDSLSAQLRGRELVPGTVLLLPR